jgi:hypothetical protein
MDLQRIRRIFDEKTPVSAEKYNNLQNRFEDQSDRYREKTIKNDAEIDSYKKVSKEMESENLRLNSQIVDLKSQLLARKESDSHGAVKAKYDNDMAAQAEFAYQAERDRDLAMEAMAEMTEDGLVKRTDCYSALFFDSESSDLHKQILLNIPDGQHFTLDIILQFLFKPKTNENKAQILQVINDFEMYHIVTKPVITRDDVYKITQQGDMLKEALKNGNDELQALCDEFDKGPES